MILNTHVSAARKVNEGFAPLLITPKLRGAKELAVKAEAEAIRRAPTENFILQLAIVLILEVDQKRLSRQ